MSQSKRGSFMESLTNVAIGITIGFVSNMVVLPLFGYDVTVGDSFTISIVFTGISLVRSYTVRRLYNKHNWFTRKD